ncbi:MAG: hypothetical protein KC621_32505 [Myxococcales bacterium]|nr:hypothetical protein [Myxococcales bacterium]
MKPVWQRRTGYGRGQCTEATIASLLEVELDAVPQLWAGPEVPDAAPPEEQQPDENHDRLRRWLLDRHGRMWVAVHLLTAAPVAVGDAWVLASEMLESLGIDAFAAAWRWHGAGGPSHRGVPHLVVAEAGRIRHDPNPTAPGLAACNTILWLPRVRDASQLADRGPGIDLHLVIDPWRATDATGRLDEYGAACDELRGDLEVLARTADRFRRLVALRDQVARAPRTDVHIGTRSGMITSWADPNTVPRSRTAPPWLSEWVPRRRYGRGRGGPVELDGVPWEAAEIVALSRAVAAKVVKGARGELEPGTHEVDLVLRVRGSIAVGHDGQRAPTASIPVKEVLALFIARSGCTREAAVRLLRECLTEALSRGVSGRGAIDAAADIDEAFREETARLIAELPATPVAGAVSSQLVLERLAR